MYEKASNCMDLFFENGYDAASEIYKAASVKTSVNLISLRFWWWRIWWLIARKTHIKAPNIKSLRIIAPQLYN